MPSVGYPTFEQLQALATIVETGSFSAAARRLNRAQSVISYAVAQLEDQLGLPMFDRAGRLPRLTPAGHAVLADARRAVATIDTLRARVGGLQQGLEAELRLAMDVMYPTHDLVAALEAFAQAFPTVTLRLYIEAMGGVPQLIGDGVCDLGVSTRLAFMPATLQQTSIGSIQLIAVAAPGHALADPAVQSAALKDATQIVLTDRTTATAGQDFGVLSPTTWRVADLGAKHALLRAGLGWGNMPEPMVRDDIAAGRLVRLNLVEANAHEYPFVLIHRSDALPGPAGGWMAQRLAGSCAREPQKSDDEEPRHGANAGLPSTRRSRFAGLDRGDFAMAKSQLRGNKEAKKPKKEKPKTIAAAAPTVKVGNLADKKK